MKIRALNTKRNGWDNISQNGQRKGKLPLYESQLSRHAVKIEKEFLQRDNLNLTSTCYFGTQDAGIEKPSAE